MIKTFCTDKERPKNPVFGVPLKEALMNHSLIAGFYIPSIFYRCIVYLDAKNAYNEEGLYRISGSKTRIDALKERFDMEGDIDLLNSEEYYDVHLIAGLLKQWLRELPESIFTSTFQEKMVRLNGIFSTFINKYRFNRHKRKN